MIRVCIALLVGAVAGWFLTTSPSEGVPASLQEHSHTHHLPGASAGQEQPSATARLDAAADEVVASLYDTWDEAHAVDRLAQFPVEHLKGLLVLCEKMPDQLRGIQIACAIHEAIGRTDFPLALELAKSEHFADDEDKDFGDPIVGFLLGSLAQRSPRAAVEKAREINRAQNSSSSFVDGTMYLRWLLSDFEGVIQQWDTDPKENTGTGALEAYLLFAPPSKLPDIAQRITAMKRADMREAMLRSLMKHWAEIDPAAACRYAFSLVDSANNQMATNQALQGWLEHAPGDALEAIAGMSDPVMRRASLENAVGHSYSAGQFQALADCIDAHPGPIAAEAVKALDQLTRIDAPADIARRLMAVWPDTRQKQDVIQTTVQDWAKQDRFDDAVSLAQGMTSIQARGKAFATIGLAWSESNRNEAVRWIESLPAGPDRDAATQGLVQKLSKSSLDDGIAWLATIQDTAIRQQSMRSIIQIWRTTDRAAASAWLDAQPGMNRVLKADLLGD